MRDEGINFDKLDELLEKKKSKINDLDKVRASKEKLEIVQEERKHLYVKYSDASTQISQMRTKFLNDVIGQDTNVKFQIQRRRNRASFIQMMKTVLNKSNATMDDGNIRKEICDVMEGTQNAFEMRAKKYHFRIVE